MENSTAIDDKIFGFAYECAMGDAVQRNAYPHHFKMEKQTDGKRKKVPKVGYENYVPTPKNKLCDLHSPKEKIKEFVDRILFGNPFTDFDDYKNSFVTIANEVKELFKNKDGVEEFTFGNVQKLMNMTLKHIYICTYGNPAFRDRFKYCHCPIDSQLATHLIQIELKYTGDNDERFRNDKPLLKKLSEEEKTLLSTPLISCIQNISCSVETTWSNMNSEKDIDNYIEIQRKIFDIVDKGEGKFGLNSLEFDYFVWHFSNFDFT